MKLTKKLEAEILKVYNDVWDAYLRGDMRTFASILDENCYIIGSAAGEVFSNKKAAVKYYKATAGQISGKAEFRNRKIKVMPVEKGFMVNEGSDFYLLIDDQWTFYGPARISSLFHKKNNKWKVIHQHGSFPDSKTEEGEQVNTDKIKAENIQLRDAVKRRTEELENKNRELEIEAALERVRARTMAMQRSEELSEAATVLYQQIHSLGAITLSCGYNIWEEGERISTVWVSSASGEMQAPFRMPHTEDNIYKHIYLAKENERDFFVEECGGEALKEHYNYLLTLPVIKDIIKKYDDEGFPRPSKLIFHIVFFKQGYLSFHTTEPCPQYWAIFRRFGAVFQQTYTRFLDLQKAEAQVREAQIEAALERVRSRSMAMHKSDDLHEVIKVVVEQLSVLSVKFNVSNFAKIDPDGSWDLWLSTPEQTYPALIHVPYIDHPIFSRITEEGTKGNDFFTDVYPRKEANIFFHHFFENTIAKNTPEERKQFVYNSKGFTRSIFLTKNIWFSVGRYDTIPFSDEENAIFKRFANVFEQAYTRFLDLQKAEAQARETEIELSLERVRAKTMAMQKPSEFVDVINIIGEQFVHLGFDIDWVNFGANGFAISEGIDIWNFALVPGTSPISARVFIPYFDHPVFTTSAENINEFLNGGRDLIIVTLDKQAKDTWLDHLFTKTIFKDVPEEYRVIQYTKSGYTTSNISLKDTWLSIGKFDIKNFTDEQHAILRRFANAFGQAYTRFLDLQKAEAQAREAQIEAGLERVRSRAMAMQTSEELNALIGTVFTELTKLDLVLTRCVIWILDKKTKAAKWWMANSEDASNPAGFFIKYHASHPYLSFLSEWEKQTVKWVYDLHGQVKKDWDDFLFSETELVNLPKFVQDGMRAPDRILLSATFNNFGAINVASLDPLSDEHYDILLRFAKVFDLTYTRFNDLKQAEAQAREARIETALERVRARTMAMQKSDELPETTFLLFQQLKGLGETATQLSIGIIKEEEGYVELSATVHGNQLLQTYHVPKDEPYVMRKAVKAWKEKQRSLILQIEGQELKDYNNWRNSVLETKINFPENRWIVNIVFFSKGMLSFSSDRQIPKETLQLLERFTGVFDLTYTRFLDLQKAEAQTREAQIELALERVRARTMAMHKSEELGETAQVLFHQLSELGGIPDRISIGIADEVNSVVNFWSTDQQGSHLDHSFSARLNERTTIAKTYRAWKEQKKSLVVDLHGEELKEWIQFAREEMGIVVKGDQIKDRRVHSFAFFSHGWILVSSHEPQSTETIQILERFASVFNLTYRRFLDLQKAEAQAREAQIEAALERVRSKTMAMHNSQDVGDTVATMLDELVKLGVETVRCGIAIIDESKTMEVWTASTKEDGSVRLIIGQLDMKTHPLFMGVYDAWKNKVPVTTYELTGEDLKDYFRAINNSRDYPTRYDMENLPYRQSNTAFMFPEGSLFVFSQEPLVTETTQIFKRFAGVFGQTYRRYLDLLKAEANAREAQIEAGLERVRAKAMAMHSSKDLAETLSVFYRELKSLSVVPIRCGVALMDKESRMAELTTMNTTGEGDSIEIIGKIKMTGHPVLDGVFESWLVQKEYHAVLRGNQIKEYYQVLKPQIDYLDYSQDEAQFGYYFMFNEGDVYAWTEKELTEDELTIYRRFTTVISLTYKRYKDLQQAEAQAREAKIEAGLERVRSKTMAMHNSDDVTSATATMFTELERLGIENMRCGIAHYLEDHKMEVWSVSNLADGKVVRGAGLLDTNSIPFWKLFYSTWQKKEDFLYYYMAGKEKEDYFKKINAVQNYLSQSIEELPDLSIQTYYFPEGSVWAFSLKPHSEDDKQVMKRFASVFSLTFRRYRDLQKAEAQTREATIEAALEKVRGKAMAMHNSNDLSVTASMIITELRKLGISPIRCGVGILNKETHKAQLYTATSSADGDSLSVVGWVMLEGHPVLEKIYETWVAGEDYFPELSGDSRKAYYEQLLAGLSVPLPDFEASQKHYGHFFAVSVGCLYTWSDVRYNDDEIKTLKRFASIIDLTFRRYFELQKSEANAREAVKQAALDRVRAEIASMRTINDLDRITPLIWNELTILGIPFIRCGVFIMDDEQQLIHTFLSTPDGKAIAAFHLPYDTPGNLAHVVANWKKNRKYIDHWDETEFIQFADILVKEGALESAEQYLKTIPHGGFYLHFLPFLQGMLYVGNTTQLGKEEIELIQHVADAFSTAYARYEDFNKLEAAKQQVEKTLTDLKQTQQQLVQAEKMASLGELTAGIAHEIQNPLNFVNNFSEVSKELLDEMKTELETGNTQEAKGIADDVIQNLEKINHHGKRADAIVKSMLQHSRSSSGKKEPADINGLADEYLRLAYHGLRAKDKSFNAKFETELDNSIGKINIISQDIGRVLVNLINNAFYAVSERKKQESNGYEPTVTVYTKKTDDKIEIKVKDNGNGIPQKVLDKIFQPFFTTKPTGQGTGLGLSLAYDIITKGHGGELKVETKEGEGSEFIIQLPVNHIK